MTAKRWRKTCSKCKTLKSYSEDYDAHYCKKCNIWLEDKCDDPFCLFCMKRPSDPSKLK